MRLKLRAPLALLFATLLSASALLTPVSAATVAEQCFPETGYCVQGRFLDYWNAHGGLAINGYPLTGEFVTVLDDGNAYTVQYFERVRMEYHPANAGTPYEVLLGQFGRRILAHVANAPTAPASPQDGYTFFPETGHNVGPRFTAYWQANGGLAQFGYPLTELFTETLDHGKSYEVQYFERARFEYHPENTAPNDILLGQFGSRVLYTESGRWLDQSQPANWNEAGAAVPAAPASLGTNGQCTFYAPPAPSAAENAVTGAGWGLVRTSLVGNGVTVVYGAVSFDGMCRPLQFQMFVFVQGNYAGTLSPLTMNSRTDGALTDVKIADDGGSIQGLFRRYNDTDPLCCPSRTSTVTFTIDTATPLVIPASITTGPTAN
ncbi:MAG: LppP/LprE family lipoprotein [Thermomicrobiales bacterium]